MAATATARSCTTPPTTSSRTETDASLPNKVLEQSKASPCSLITPSRSRWLRFAATCLMAWYHPVALFLAFAAQHQIR
jgi:hypothetical protein